MGFMILVTLVVLGLGVFGAALPFVASHLRGRHR